MHHFPAPSLEKNYSWWPCASKLYYLCALLPTCWLVYCNFIKMVSKPAHRHMGMLGDSTQQAYMAQNED